jgi:hexokinase
MADPKDEFMAFLQPLVVDGEKLHRLARQFATTYKHLALTSQEQFLPTPTTLPTGDETGTFLAIDLGGTYLRVGFVELLGAPSTPIDQNIAELDLEDDQEDAPRIRRSLERAWPIGEHLKKDKAEDLFAWIGECIKEVLVNAIQDDSENELPPELDIGVTFSFPMM